jgi:hypothetical protein
MQDYKNIFKKKRLLIHSLIKLSLGVVMKKGHVPSWLLWDHRKWIKKQHATG